MVIRFWHITSATNFGQIITFGDSVVTVIVNISVLPTVVMIIMMVLNLTQWYGAWQKVYWVCWVKQLFFGFLWLKVNQRPVFISFGTQQ